MYSIDACGKYHITEDDEMNKAYRQILREYERRTAFIGGTSRKLSEPGLVLEMLILKPSILIRISLQRMEASIRCAECMTLTELINQRTELLKK